MGLLAPQLGVADRSSSVSLKARSRPWALLMLLAIQHKLPSKGSMLFCWRTYCAVRAALFLCSGSSGSDPVDNWSGVGLYSSAHITMAGRCCKPVTHSYFAEFRWWPQHCDALRVFFCFRAWPWGRATSWRTWEWRRVSTCIRCIVTYCNHCTGTTKSILMAVARTLLTLYHMPTAAISVLEVGGEGIKNEPLEKQENYGDFKLHEKLSKNRLKIIEKSVSNYCDMVWEPMGGLGSWASPELAFGHFWFVHAHVYPIELSLLAKVIRVWMPLLFQLQPFHSEPSCAITGCGIFMNFPCAVAGFATVLPTAMQLDLRETGWHLGQAQDLFDQPKTKNSHEMWFCMR